MLARRGKKRRKESEKEKSEESSSSSDEEVKIYRQELELKFLSMIILLQIAGNFEGIYVT